MPIEPDRLVGFRLPEIAQTYAPRDAILYALGVGLGHDPCAREDLKFLVEDGLEVLPTFAVTLASPGMWIRAPEFGVDFIKLLHGEQAAWFHAPLPPEAEVVGSARVLSLPTVAPDEARCSCSSERFETPGATTPIARCNRLCFCAATGASAARRRLSRRRSFLSGRRTSTAAPPSTRGRRSSIDCRAIATRCTPTPTSPGERGSNVPFCTASRAMPSPE